MVWIWIGFVALVLALLALDLGVFHRKAHVVKIKEALGWSAVWITLAMLFSVFVYVGYEHHWMGLGTAPDPVDQQINNGTHAVTKYLTGYVIEKSLSVDNIFVIAVLFGFFKVPAMYQHRVLFWGILGALLLRGVMIGVGATLIERFHWILYVFGAFLIVTAVRMMFMKADHGGNVGENIVVKTVRRMFPVTTHFHGEHFVVRAGSTASHEAATPSEHTEPDKAVEHVKPGRLMLTPLALSLIMVETTDLVFAVDSIPAIFAITGDPFLVFTSNVFAILGLRSLYFALAGMMDKFRYLKLSLAVVLGIVGVKMLAVKWLKEALGEHFNFYLLGIVLGVLTLGVVASILANRRDAREGIEPAPAQ
jgi:tellurite resistance protein TerC